jgi:hypothetical protein
MLRIVAIAAVIAAFLTVGADAATVRHTDLNPQPLPPICAYGTTLHDRFPLFEKFLVTIGLPVSPCAR